jgi:hypothetical protein
MTVPSVAERRRNYFPGACNKRRLRSNRGYPGLRFGKEKTIVLKGNSQLTERSEMLIELRFHGKYCK